MKTNKLMIMAGLLLLPALICAQERPTQEQANDKIVKIITEVNDGGVSFTIPDMPLNNAEISAIKNELDKEVKRIQEEHQFKQLCKTRVDENREKILALCPNIQEQPLQKILWHLAEMSKTYNYFNYADAKYYEKAELCFDKTNGSKKVLTFDNTIFFFYTRFVSDEGTKWDEWMIFGYDTNTGDFKYRHEFGMFDKEITLTNLLNPKEVSVYKDNFR